MKRDVHQIYFARATRTKETKIGRTTGTLTQRISSLRVQEKLKYRAVVLYAFATFNQDAEQVMHDLFREYRIRGEWFAISEWQIQCAIAAWLRKGTGLSQYQMDYWGKLTKRPA